MKIYYVPVKVVEHGRMAIVEANSPAEARKKARAGNWLESTDEGHTVVTVVGAVEVHPNYKS